MEIQVRQADRNKASPPLNRLEENPATKEANLPRLLPHRPVPQASREVPKDRHPIKIPAVPGLQVLQEVHPVPPQAGRTARQASPDSNLQEGFQILEHRDKISQVEAAQAEGTLPREIVVVKSRSPSLPSLQQAPLVLQVVVRTERQASPGSRPRRRLLILGHKNRIKAVQRVQAKKILPRGKLPKEKAVARSLNLALPQNLLGVGNTFPCPLLPFLPPIRKEQGVKIQANSLLEREGRLIKGHNKGKPKKKN